MSIAREIISLIMSRRRIIPLIDRILGEAVVEEIITDEMRRMMEAKKNEWRSMGASESLVRMAEELAYSWLYKITSAMAPPELRRRIAEYNFPKALKTADEWVRAFISAKAS